MVIPTGLKVHTIVVNCIQKEEVKEPQVFWRLWIQAMKMFKSGKESSPMLSELCSNLNPQPLNSRIVG